MLLSFTEELVQGFYDALFAHRATSSVFQEGERPAREETLRGLWTRVAQGPHDAVFWEWMAWVGIVHIRRRVKNNMMAGAWGYILGLCQQNTAGALPPQEATSLLEDLQRLAATAQALTAEGYRQVHLEALRVGTGMSQELLDTVVFLELLPTLEKQAKK